MRQVPQYLIIGNGRVARHFKYYFEQLQLPFCAWQRQQPLSELSQLLKQSSHILLLIPDAAIDEFILQNLANTTAICIHFSGSLVSEQAYGAHPLMTFSHELYDLNQYQTIPFIIDDDALEFSKLLPGLSNQHVRLAKALKAKYHALCVLSGNFSCMLWQKFFTTLEQEFNFPASIGQPYLLQQTQNILTNYKTALTGPLVRNDQLTLEKNLAALEGDHFQQIYQSFIDCFKKITKEN